MAKQQNRLRNSVARALIMRKGGMHRKSRSGERGKAKQDLLREARSLSVEKSKGAGRPPYSSNYGFSLDPGLAL